ncbi:MAG: signal peptidase II [Lachnospiraceae bacterium]|nr:signal peptidase II [Lachnospiraceae bacterium]
MKKQKSFLTHIITLVGIFLFLFLDQFTKVLAKGYLMGHKDKILIPGVLQLHYLENQGAAFSLLNGKLVFFYIITPVLCIAIAILYKKLPGGKRFLPLNCILTALMAGAIGNYIDRILYHKVTDFIYFSLIDFPVFNVADIYVTVSIVVLLILVFFYYKDEDFDLWLKK